MKILIVIDGLGTGGAERSTEVICDYLYDSKVSFEVLCLDQRTVGVQQKMQEKSYKISFVPTGNFYSQSKYIANYIKKRDFQLVHSILFRSNLRTRFAKLFFNFVHIESLVNTTYSKERFNDKRVNQKALWFYKKVDKNSASWGVDHFHSITEAVKKHYINEINLIPERITVIPRGRKPLLDDFSQRQGSKGGAVTLLNIGRHEFQKGQIYLLKALKVLVDKSYSLELIILGRSGSVTQELEEFISENNLQDFVRLEGFKENVNEYLLTSDVFVFPSLFEGLGGSLIEAQAAGLPIACNDIPVLQEVVEENENAKFFDVHDTNSIVKSIEFFLDDPAQRKIYGKKSLKNYQEKYVEKVNNEKLLDLYKALAAEK